MEIGKLLNLILSPLRSPTGILTAVVTWLTIVAGVLFYLASDANFLGEGGMILIPLLPFVLTGEALVMLFDATFHVELRRHEQAEAAVVLRAY